MYEYLEGKSESVAKSTFSDLSSTTSNRTAYFRHSFRANMLLFCTTAMEDLFSVLCYKLWSGAVVSSLGVEGGGGHSTLLTGIKC